METFLCSSQRVAGRTRKDAADTWSCIEKSAGKGWRGDGTGGSGGG